MILCGGQGTRLRDVTEILPKPLVPIGSRPIVWHVMKTHAAFGVRRFILCLGYKREAFVDYFLNYRMHQTDVTIRLGRNGDVTLHGDHGEEDWEVTLADTGEGSMTGARVARALKYVPADREDFFLSYGDGLADVDIGRLLEHHEKHGRGLTVTAVMPDSRFGVLQFDGDLVEHFREKPRDTGTWINGGYMVATRRFVERYLVDDDSCVLEQEPMRRAAGDHEMSAHRHDGYWQCMDTARDYAVLTAQWESGKAPWTKHWR
jgi:glucose-1-phosphate cytidylyltransferase